MPCPPIQIRAHCNCHYDLRLAGCLDLAQANAVDQPQIDTDNLSISSFNTGHIPGKQVAVDDNSLATAQTSMAGTVEEADDSALASTTVQGAKTLVPVDVDADDLASM